MTSYVTYVTHTEYNYEIQGDTLRQKLLFGDTLRRIETQITVKRHKEAHGDTDLS